ncbi:hypothetical protein vBYenSP400_44 [Yersinia phage vB_YenS_P400]|nr:hypothetical protein vBYenSP400_44 [Yersinia phage vB_YenS_P400]
MPRRYCTCCGTLLTECPECGEWFAKKRIDQILCRERCRQRKSRRERDVTDKHDNKEDCVSVIESVNSKEG